MEQEYVVLDMFAGAGGLTEGFFRNNFNIIGHIEMDPYAAKTLETRSLYHALLKKNRKDLYYSYYYGDMPRDEFIQQCNLLGIQDPGIINKEIRRGTEAGIINNIYERLKAQDLKKVDVIIGGPPCQAYSVVGRSRDPNNMVDDPRNTLYLHYIKFLKTFSPDVFVFENVPGLTSAKDGAIYADFIRRINKIGYRTASQPPILRSSDFGVLQDRRRIIFIGWKAGNNMEYPVFSQSKTKYKVWDLLKDLPALEPGKGTDKWQRYDRIKKSKYLLVSGIRTDEKFVRHHAARPHNERDRSIYRIAITKWNESHERIKYPDLPDNLKTHRNQTSFLDRFKVVNGDGLSHAIVAHLSKDGHHYIHPDIDQARSITVREAARIQSFPDNYLFEGPRTSQYVQIGNAVPPLMAGEIAKKIKSILDGYK